MPIRRASRSAVIAEAFLTSVSHAYLHRAGNFSCLLSNAVLLLSIDGILLVLIQHHVDPAIRNHCPISIISFLASKFRNLSFSSVLPFTIVHIF